MPFYVGDKYRTNSLSLQKGGFDVMIFYTDHQPRVYRRVKVPYLFYKKAVDENGNVKGYKILQKSL